MLHGVFGGEERRGHIVEAVFDLDLQVRIRKQRLHQIAFDVRRAGEKAASAPALVFPVPVTAYAFADRVVSLVLAEFQVVANVTVEGGSKRAGDRSALRVGLGEFAQEIVGQAGIAGIQASGGEAAMALQFFHELAERDAQVGFDQIVFGQTRVAGQLLGHVRLFRRGQLRTLHQGGSVFGCGELARFLDEGGQVIGAIFQDLVIPGGGGVAGEIEDVGHIRARKERKRAKVEDVGDEDDAVEVHAVMRLQVVTEGGGAERAVAFADEEFGRVPPAITADVHGDELRERFYVLVDAPEILVLRFADGVAEAGADGIEEHHVGFVEQRAGIVGEFVRRRRSGFRVRGEHATRAESAHVQPHRSGAGAAVVDERDGTLREVLGIGADVGSGIDQGLRLVFFIL